MNCLKTFFVPRLRTTCSFYRSEYKQSLRQLTCSQSLMASHDAEFNKAKEQLGLLKEDPGNMVKLQLYALFKQATVGVCNAKKPSMVDFVGKAKYDAWNKLGQMSKDDAQLEYIKLVNKLSAEESPVADTESGTMKQYNQLLVTNENRVFKIVLNRPKKKNAITLEMYSELCQALEEATTADCSVAVITGAGDYFCSGNDLSNFTNIAPNEISTMAQKSSVVLQKFVAAFIDFPKPLIALINGPAVGISVTILGLFDAVYASDKATFHTPFSALGQSPEGCSSYIFPKLMGMAKASELLLFNQKISAVEACERNLVTEVIPDGVFAKETEAKIKQYAAFPPLSMSKSKVLCRQNEIEKLHQVNKAECNLLIERWQSKECEQAIMAFFTRKSKM